MPKKSPGSTLTRATNQLLEIYHASTRSTSRFEDRYWDTQIDGLLRKHLTAGQDEVIEAALDELAKTDADQADDLFEHVQASCQTLEFEIKGQPWQAILVTSAFAMWTRYQLPQVEVTDGMLQQFTDALKQTVLAPEVQIAALPKLVGIDEMPRSFSQTYEWLNKLANRAVGKRAAMPTTITVELNPALLVDTRHLVMALVVPKGQPIFRWQADPSIAQETCQSNWGSAIGPVLAQLLPGCQFHALVPQLYHTSIELSEQHMRLIAIISASEWLHSTLNLKPGELRATIAAVGEQGVQEYRIGYHRGRQQDVIYGTIWPVFDNAGSTENGSIVNTVDEIAAILKDCGIEHVKRIPGVLLPEACDDCSAPFFPNPSGELVHVDLPEEAFDAPAHFH